MVDFRLCSPFCRMHVAGSQYSTVQSVCTHKSSILCFKMPSMPRHPASTNSQSKSSPCRWTLLLCAIFFRSDFPRIININYHIPMCYGMAKGRQHCPTLARPAVHELTTIRFSTWTHSCTHVSLNPPRPFPSLSLYLLLLWSTLVFWTLFPSSVLLRPNKIFPTLHSYSQSLQNSNLNHSSSPGAIL